MGVRKILITGAAGHIGSFLIHYLSEVFPKHKIILYDNFHTQRYVSLFGLEGDFQVVEADIKDGIEPADIVIHLAALTDPQESLTNASRYFEVNHRYTCNIAEYCQQIDAHLIFASTTSTQSKESPTPYTLSKVMAEDAVRASGGTVLRFGTIVGPSPGMRFHTAINRFCWQAALHKPLTVYQSAIGQIKPYCDLSEAVAAIIHCMERECVGSFDVATENWPIEKVLEVIGEIHGDIDVEYVQSDIRGESLTVSDEEIRKTGFTYRGSVEEQISLIFHLFGGWGWNLSKHGRPSESCVTTPFGSSEIRSDLLKHWGLSRN